MIIDAIDNISRINHVGIIGSSRPSSSIIRESLRNNNLVHLEGEYRSVGVPKPKSAVEEYVEAMYPPVGKGKRKRNNKKKSKKRRKR